MTDHEFSGINQIEVDHYKSIQQLTIDFKPVTILAGANSTGKSSVMQPLLLMKQTLDTNSSSALALQGKNVNLTSFEQIKSRIPGVKSDTFSLRVQTQHFFAQSVFSGNDDTVTLDSSCYGFLDQDGAEFEKMKIVLSRTTSPETLRDWMCRVYRGLAEIVKEDMPFSPRADACFYSVYLKQPPGTQLTISPDFRPSALVEADIRGIIHLPGWRDNPQRLYENISLESPFFRGTFPRYTASVIASWERHKNEKYEQLLRYLHDLNLSTELHAKPRGKQIELTLSRLIPRNESGFAVQDTDDVVNIADVGIGVSQALPIIASLIVAEKNQIVYIEQPGIHLHSRAHIGLARAILDAAYRGVKVVVETHSSTFLLALQAMIAERKKMDLSLAHDQIALYWFYQNELGETKMIPGTMRENGTYGDWPVDFSRVTMDLQLRFMKALDEHGENQ